MFRWMGVILAVLMTAAPIGQPVRASDDEVLKLHQEIVRLREENTRLRTVAAHSVDELQARTNEVALHKQLITLMKRENELMKEIEGINKRIAIEKDAQCSRHTSQLDQLEQDVLAFSDFWEAVITVCQNDTKLVHRFRTTAKKPGELTKQFEGLRWGFRTSLEKRVSAITILTGKLNERVNRGRQLPKEPASGANDRLTLSDNR